ncbi:MAG TPA: cysteine desulfurase [Thermoanaerobaculia bacterium]
MTTTLEDRTQPTTTPAAFDVERLRRDFPALGQTVNGHPLVYLDSAASAQKPRAMLEAVARAYAYDYSNVHRGVHTLSQRATAAYEGARETLARFLGAAEAAEIVFVRGTTEGLNLVAQSFARPRLAPGDEVLVSHMEHHSNIVPWQLVCEATGARLKVAPISDDGELDLDAFARLLGERTRIVALVHVSNALGTIVPVAEVVRLAHARGVPVVLDGAQAAPHLPLDVRELGCDFYTVSGHKLFGPTGIGVLYGRRELLEAMAPYQGGGEMILNVSFAKSEYKEPPHRFEAGTPNIVGAIGLGAVVDYLEAIGMERIAAYEGELLAYGRERLAAVPGLRLIGTARHKAALFSFVIEGVHAHDVGTILDQQGIAVRAGHHCAQPAMERFGIAATARASLAFYNTREEIDRLVDGLAEVREIFG